MGYWSLFVDGSFEKGMSHKGATYTNTHPLSADTKFEVCHNFFPLPNLPYARGAVTDTALSLLDCSLPCLHADTHRASMHTTLAFS